MAKKPGLVGVQLPTDPQAWDDAVAAFRARVPMTREQWDALTASARQRAFTASSVAQMDVLNDLWLGIDDAIARGATFGEFLKQTLPSVTEAWQGTSINPSARLETIFRTNVAQANATGRQAMLDHPVVKRRRPYLQYRAITDGRICPICSPLDGIVLPADDPFWRTHTPPLHFCCRCILIALTVEEADDENAARAEQGLPLTPPSNHRAQKGFGVKPVPVGDGDGWKPDLSKYPPQLALPLKDKLNGQADDT